MCLVTSYEKKKNCGDLKNREIIKEVVVSICIYRNQLGKFELMTNGQTNTRRENQK